MHQPEPPSRRVIQALGPTATTAVGADRISTGQATVSGSLKGDILYLRRPRAEHATDIATNTSLAVLCQVARRTERAARWWSVRTRVAMSVSTVTSGSVVLWVTASSSQPGSGQAGPARSTPKDTT